MKERERPRYRGDKSQRPLPGSNRREPVMAGKPSRSLPKSPTSHDNSRETAIRSHHLDYVPISLCTDLMAMGRPFDLPYSVELWDNEDSHVEELIALTG